MEQLYKRIEMDKTIKKKNETITAHHWGYKKTIDDCSHGIDVFEQKKSVAITTPDYKKK